MIHYPVHYAVEKPERFTRVLLVARVLAFLVLGMFGLSLGSLFVIACVALPVVAAIRLAGRAPADVLASDGPRLVRALRWYAAVYGWFGLVTERMPSRSPDETVHVDVEIGGTPTVGSCLLRIVFGIPSAIVLALLAVVGSFVWLWAALCVLFRERIGDDAYAFLVGMQRWSVRLLAYQASLVEAYPPFSFEDAPPAITGAPAMPTLR